MAALHYNLAPPPRVAPGPLLGNRLLQSCAGEWAPWQAHFELLHFAQDQLLHDTGQLLEYLYFPTTAVVSLQHQRAGGGTVEIAVLGNEGVAGMSLIADSSAAPYRAALHLPGYCYRLPAAVAHEVFNRNPVLRGLLLRYTQALVTQMAQLAVCNRHHKVEQQVCRWLLGMQQHTEAGQLNVTQRQIADLLGVRREGVATAMVTLASLGVLSNQRGHITVLDGPALLQHACECHGVISREYQRLLFSDH